MEQPKTPVPEVVGPIPADPRGQEKSNYPFLSTDLMIEEHGYLEEEFFYSGQANWYDLELPSPSWDAAVPLNGIVSGGHDFKTRMVVIRPKDPARFSGTVIAEWTNVSSSYDTPVWWQRNHDYIVREGHAHVAIAAQHKAVHAERNGLVEWNPERYGSLSIPDLAPDPDDALFVQDHLSYDVYAHGVKAIREVPAVLGGLEVERIIAGGHSRSAMMLQRYINSIHPGDPLVDGCMLLIQGGEVREDIEVPVMMVLSESEFVGEMGVTFAAKRQADSKNFRTWWATGTSHSDHPPSTLRAGVYDRDLRGEPMMSAVGDVPSMSRVESHHVVSAAMEAMVRWIRDGIAPPSSPLPAFDSEGVLVRDADGNGLGGIRLATLAVPVARSAGVNPDPYGYGGIHGIHEPFTPERLAELYPTHEAFIAAFKGALDQNVRDGFLLLEDAATMLADARAGHVGEGLVDGPLCADVGNFLHRPSTRLLRDHTRLYGWLGGGPLVRLADEANRSVAQAYSAARAGDTGQQRQHLEAAVKTLGDYAAGLDDLVARGGCQPRSARLLKGFAAQLVDELEAELKSSSAPAAG